MKNYQRILNFEKDIQRKSLFLFGPRLTGKTSLLKKLFPQSTTYNLLHSKVFLQFSQRPWLLREELSFHTPKQGPVIIDEVQKLPILLDEVQALIDEQGLNFILTGSSPRKLKRGGANLLGGRALTRHLHPLVYPEIKPPNFMKIINTGSLPSIYNSSMPLDDLRGYIGNYLQEEIQAEGLSRRIENFSRFLQTAALCNGELINFESVASDAQVPARTVREYFRVLEDTLLAYLLPPYTKTIKRKAISTAKFYFFDVGVANCLAERSNIKQKSELFGNALEHYIFTELKASQSYLKDFRPLTFWRSKAGHEVDFILGDEIAIEVKGTESVDNKHLQGLKALMEEKIKFKRYMVVSLDQKPRKMGSIEVLPIRLFLEKLWDGL